MGFSGMELESRCDAIIVKRTRSDPSPLRGGVASEASRGGGAHRGTRSVDEAILWRHRIVSPQPLPTKPTKGEGSPPRLLHGHRLSRRAKEESDYDKR